MSEYNVNNNNGWNDHTPFVPVVDNGVMNNEQVQAPVLDEPLPVEVRHDDHIEQLEQAVVTQPVGVVNEPVHLLSPLEISELQSRWNAIQIRFVDEPRSSVEQADALVTDALAQIEQVFANKRTGLEKQWNNQADISTEELRTALKSYRTFFNMVLKL